MSVQKRVRGGRVRWVGRYRDPAGREHSQTFETRKHAKAWVDENERDIRRRDWVDPVRGESTVRTLWAAWVQAATNPRTKNVRERVGRNLGELADYPASAVRTVHLRSWLAHLQDGRPWADAAPLAPNTIRSWWGQMRGCWAMAVDDGVVTRSPCEGVRPGLAAAPVDPTKLPTAAEIKALADKARATNRETLSVMIELAASTGLRSGEVAGLRVRSLDLLRRQLHVLEQSTPADSTDSWTALKPSSAARRTVPLTDDTVKLLAAHLAQHPADRDDPVFRSRTGLMWHSGAVSAAMKALSDGSLTFHGLRHYYASALIRQGLGVKTVQTLLGHASAETTLSTYVHLFPDEDERARDAIAAALRAGPVRDGAVEAAVAGETKAPPP